MRYFLIFLAIVLAIALVIGIWVFVDNKNEETLKHDLMEAMADHCDRAIETMYQRGSSYDIYSIDYEITDLVEIHDDLIYVVNVNWYVHTNETWNSEGDKAHWMNEVASTDPVVLTVNDKTYFVSYSHENYAGGCTLFYNDYGAINGAAHYADINGNKQNASTTYYEVTCAHCGMGFRGTSSYGRRIQTGKPCGFSGCGE